MADPRGGDRAVPWAGPVRVFISYAHDDDVHEDRVRELWLLLRANGIDASVDLPAAEQRVDWAEWMTQQVRDAGRVLVVASPEYRRRAEGDAGPDEGRGVQWEARLIRDRFYADQRAGLEEILPVVLPGGSVADIPLWLGRVSTTHYEVTDYTVGGAERLVRVLTGQPLEVAPAVGPVPVLPPRGAGVAAGLTGGGLIRPGLRTEVVIEAAVDAGGVLASVVWVAGTLLSRRQRPLPAEVTGVWAALSLPAAAAGERVAAAGRSLAGALLDDQARQVLGGLLGGLPGGDAAEVVWCASGAALALPVELIRLPSGDGGQMPPLGLLAGVSITPADSACRAAAWPGRRRRRLSRRWCWRGR